jgi:hypothetical protein
MKINTALGIVLCLLIFISCSSEKSSCERRLLLGNWYYSNYYKGKLTTIKDVERVIPKSRFGLTIFTFKIDDTFIDDQGDHQTKGIFRYNENNCSLFLNYNQENIHDSLDLNISYMDEENLLLFDKEDNSTKYYIR